MPVRLSTTVSKITSLPNSTNAALISEFYQYMKNNGASESHTNNSLKTNMAFVQFLVPDVTFYDVKTKEQNSLVNTYGKCDVSIDGGGTWYIHMLVNF